LIKPSYVSNFSGSDFEDLDGVVVELAGAVGEIAGVVVELSRTGGKMGVV
jgi:hypothetical protein